MNSKKTFLSPSSPPSAIPPGRVCILGAGRFGAIAAHRLSQRYPEGEFLVVDTRRDKLAEIQRTLGHPVLEQEAVSFLERTSLADDTWIIPAVPIHVAFHWMLHALKKAGEAHALPVPESVDSQVPNPYRTGSGTLYASYATFLCPDACNEPDAICTHTGKARPGNLFEHLAGVQIEGYRVIVVRSWQLAPGVGGYPAGSLENALSGITEAGRYLIATSCRCHGVIDALYASR